MEIQISNQLKSYHEKHIASLNEYNELSNILSPNHHQNKTYSRFSLATTMHNNNDKHEIQNIKIS